MINSPEATTLNQYATNLTNLIRANPDSYDAFGREKEIEEVITTLGQKKKNNPVLVGEPGVGKTAIVEGLVKRIVRGQVPEPLKKARVWRLELAALMEDPRKFTGLFLKLIEELKTLPDDILFIDEIHTIMGAGGEGKALDASNVLKPALGRGEIRLIGATTIKEFHDYIEVDGAFTRRMNETRVDEPSVDQSQLIVQKSKPMYEKYYHLTIDDQAVESAVLLADRYVTESFFPDKALSLLDRTCSFAQLKNESVVTVELVGEVLQDTTGIPLNTILKDESRRLDDTMRITKQRVLGQDPAVNEVLGSIISSYAGLQDPNKPISSFLFLGTPGVGKTELAKALAEGMFGDEDAMIRFDMSEYQAPQSARRLIGTDGSGSGTLTEAVKRKPYSIILLDEIEKADRSVHDLFLQILQDGVVHDNYNRRISFQNTIIIMTTNLAARRIISEDRYIENPDEAKRKAEFNKMVANALRDFFRPEFVNRIEHKIVFQMIDEKVGLTVAKKYLKELESRLETQGFTMSFQQENELVHENDDGSKYKTFGLPRYLVHLGLNETEGARPLGFMVNRKVRDVLAKTMMMYSKNGNPNKINHFYIYVTGRWPENNLPKRDLYGDLHLKVRASSL